MSWCLALFRMRLDQCVAPAYVVASIVRLLAAHYMALVGSLPVGRDVLDGGTSTLLLCVGRILILRICKGSLYPGGIRVGEDSNLR